MVSKLLCPEDEEVNKWKQTQLRELAAINGGDGGTAGGREGAGAGRVAADWSGPAVRRAARPSAGPNPRAARALASASPPARHKRHAARR
jgi:hypothetical protein